MLDSVDIKKMNTDRIRLALWSGDRYTKLSMASETGLSVATCNTVLNKLIESGEVKGEKRQLNGIGRSSMVFSLNENFETILCIRFDLYSDNKRIVNIDAISMLGNSLKSQTYFYDTLSVEQIGNHIQEFMDIFDNISLILVGSNGIISNGHLRMSDIPEIEGINIEQELTRYCHNIPLHVKYDCQFMAYGAYHHSNNYNNSASTVTLMHCIKNVIPGTASVVDGKIIHGKNGFAGMTGYMYRKLNHPHINKNIASGDSNVIYRTIVSIITVLNPNIFIFAGNIITKKDINIIREECAKYLPIDFLPEFRVAEDDGTLYYLEGMYHMAIDIKTVSYLNSNL